MGLTPHELSRKKVCCLCFNKSGSQRKCSKTVTSTLETSIKKIIPTYNVNDPTFPTGLCNSCFIYFKTHNLKNFVDYSKIKISLKHNKQSCSCAICIVANSKSSNPIISNITIVKQKIGRPSLNPSNTKSSFVKICTKCNGILKKGVKHKCCKSQKVINSVGIIHNVEQQVAATVILSEEASQSSPIVELNKGRGHSVKVSVKRKADKENVEPLYSVESLQNIQQDLGLPMRKMIKLTAHLRAPNKRVVEANAVKHLMASTHAVDEFFSVENLAVIDSKRKEISIPFAYCSDLARFSSTLLEKRGLDNNIHYKIGIDGGGGSLKVNIALLCFSSNFNIKKLYF